MTSAPRPITPADLWQLARVGPPVPAPDGSFFVVGTKTADLEKDELRERLWRAWPGATPEPLTAADVSSGAPAISPDGRRIAFVRKMKDQPQVWVLPLAGGEAEPVTDLPLGAADPLEVDQHPGGEQRSGEGPTAGLVHSGHEAAAEGAIEAEEPRGGALLPPPLRRLRRSRFGLEASRWRWPCR
jgi:hypothetical protein